VLARLCERAVEVVYRGAAQVLFDTQLCELPVGAASLPIGMPRGRQRVIRLILWGEQRLRQNGGDGHRRVGARVLDAHARKGEHNRRSAN
jgi:hypothetical protein